MHKSFPRFTFSMATTQKNVINIIVSTMLTQFTFHHQHVTIYFSFHILNRGIAPYLPSKYALQTFSSKRSLKVSSLCNWYWPADWAELSPLLSKRQALFSNGFPDTYSFYYRIWPWWVDVRIRGGILLFLWVLWTLWHLPLWWPCLRIIGHYTNLSGLSDGKRWSWNI